MEQRRELLKAMALLAPLASAQGARLPEATLSAAQAKLSKEPFGEHRLYFDGSTGQLKAMTAGSVRLNPGASPHPPHQHDEEEFLLVTEGSGEISIEGKVTRVEAGAMMYCGARRVHGIANTGKLPMTFFYYKWKA